MLLNINGCTTTGISKNSYDAQYRIASDECIRFGLRCGSYDYKRFIEKRLETAKQNLPAEKSDHYQNPVQ